MTPTLIPTEIYEHPDGYGISVAKNALIAWTDEGNFVVLPIGKPMMLELSKKLYDLAMKD